MSAEEYSTTEMIQTLRNLSKVEIESLPSDGVLLYGIDGAEIRSEPSISTQIVLNKPIIHRVYLRYGNYKVGWIVDGDIQRCLICNLKFNWFNRRHHCRNCGIIICHDCSTHRVLIRQLKKEIKSFFDKPESRVCNLCASKHRLNEIWDAKPTLVVQEKDKPNSPIIQLLDDSSLMIPPELPPPETPTTLPTNPNQYLNSEPVPLNLNPIMNNELTPEPIDSLNVSYSTDILDSSMVTTQPATPIVLQTPEVVDRRDLLVSNDTLPPLSIHAFSVDDNDENDGIEEDDEQDENTVTRSPDTESSTPQQANRRGSWLDTIGLGALQLQMPFGNDRQEDQKPNEDEAEGEGGIDSESEDGGDDNASSASGDSVNSSRLSSRRSRNSRNSRSYSRRYMSEDEGDSFVSSEQFPSPISPLSPMDHTRRKLSSATSPASRPSKRNGNNLTSPPLSPLSSENEGELESQSSTSPMSPTESNFTIRELQLHTEQQRLVQIAKQMKAEKLSLQQSQKATTKVTPDSLPDKDKEQSTPSPAKRRSSLMWFFGAREENSDEAVSQSKNPIVMRRGSDPGSLKTLERTSDLSKDSGVVSHSNSLPTST